MNLIKNYTTYTTQTPYTKGVQQPQSNAFITPRHSELDSEPHKDVFTRTKAKSPSSSLNFKAFSFPIPPDLVKFVTDMDKPPIAKVVNRALVIDSNHRGHKLEMTALEMLISGLSDGGVQGTFKSTLNTALSNRSGRRRRKSAAPLTGPIAPPPQHPRGIMGSVEMTRRLVADLGMTGNRVDVSGLSKRQRTFLEQQAENYCTAATNEEKAAIRDVVSSILT